MGHGLAAYAVGGSLERLAINADASGLAYTRHGPGLAAAIVSLGGMLAPPLFGALLLATVRGPRRARIVLVALAVGLAASALIWVRTPVGLAVVGVFAVLFGLAGVKAGPSVRMWLVQIVSVVCALDTLTRAVSYAFKTTGSGGVAGLRSDVSSAAESLGVPHFLLACAVVVASLILLALGLWAGLRRGREEGAR
jgi:hypothetical protein